MTGYLTNVTLSDEVENRVKVAAEKSGMKVEYRNHPMPNEAYEYDGYNSSKHVGFLGSIYTYEDFDVDLGPFWEEYDLMRAGK